MFIGRAEELAELFVETLVVILEIIIISSIIIVRGDYLDRIYKP